MPSIKHCRDQKCKYLDYPRLCGVKLYSYQICAYFDDTVGKMPRFLRACPIEDKTMTVDDMFPK